MDLAWVVTGAFRRERFLDWPSGSVGGMVLRDATAPVFLPHRRRVGLQQAGRMDRGGWKLWCRRHERVLCYIVAADDRAQAAKALRQHGAFAEVLDVGPCPPGSSRF